jgi:ectoine hydroxylase-related dioxygenase (phytanoyl-CoA dioxygenase family)
LVCAFDQDGFSILPGVFGSGEIESLIAAVARVGEEQGVRSRTGVYAIRNLLEVSPAIRALANSPKVRAIVEAHLGTSAFPVRGTLFDKIVGANWLVPWHRDLTICVADRVDVPSYGPWTRKAGVFHVQPPASVLEGMLSLRIHLDHCEEPNGALRVLQGTHKLGRLTAAQVAEEQRARASIACVARAGDVLLLRPLLVHASSAASQATHRRVIHIDYASSHLDGGLRWRTH